MPIRDTPGPLLKKKKLILEIGKHEITIPISVGGKTYNRRLRTIKYVYYTGAARASLYYKLEGPGGDFVRSRHRRRRLSITL